MTYSKNPNSGLPSAVGMAINRARYLECAELAIDYLDKAIEELRLLPKGCADPNDISRSAIRGLTAIQQELEGLLDLDD